MLKSGTRSKSHFKSGTCRGVQGGAGCMGPPTRAPLWGGALEGGGGSSGDLPRKKPSYS